MNNLYLTVKWDYTYDKESTWYDNDSGEERYPLEPNTQHSLPHISKKSLDILSVVTEGDKIEATIHVDSSTYTVTSGNDPVIAYVHDSYSVCGDSVSQSLCLKLSI